jgi:hypothetical protein
VVGSGSNHLSNTSTPELATWDSVAARLDQPATPHLFKAGAARVDAAGVAVVGVVFLVLAVAAARQLVVKLAARGGGGRAALCEKPCQRAHTEDPHRHTQQPRQTDTRSQTPTWHSRKPSAVAAPQAHNVGVTRLVQRLQHVNRVLCCLCVCAAASWLVWLVVQQDKGGAAAAAAATAASTTAAAAATATGAAGVAPQQQQVGCAQP